MAFNPYAAIGAFYRNLGVTTAQCAGALGGLMGQWNGFFTMAMRTLEVMQLLAKSETQAIQPVIDTIIRCQTQQLEIMAQAFDRYISLAGGLSSIRSTIDRVNFAIKESIRCSKAANGRGPNAMRPDAIQAYLDSNRELVGICAKFDIQRYIQWVNLCQSIKHAQLVLSTTSINTWSREATEMSTEVTPAIAMAQANLFAGLEFPHGMKVESILYQEAYQESALMQQSPDAIAALPTQPPQQMYLVPPLQHAVSPGDPQALRPGSQNSQMYNPTIIPRSVTQQQYSQTMVQGPQM